MDPWVVGVDPGGTKIEVDLVDSVEPDRGPPHTHQPRSRAAQCRRPHRNIRGGVGESAARRLAGSRTRHL